MELKNLSCVLKYLSKYLSPNKRAGYTFKTVFPEYKKYTLYSFCSSKVY